MSTNSKAKDLVENQQVSDFATKEYWNSFFNTTGEEFEWYAHWNDIKNEVLRILLSNAVSFKELSILKCLVAGCGNSTLSFDLYQSGFKNIISTDYSEELISDLKAKYPDLYFVCQDMVRLEFDSHLKESMFDIIFDKGCLDAIFTSNEEVEPRNNAEKYLNNCHALLSTRYRFFFVVSLLQDFILDLLIDVWENWKTYHLQITSIKLKNNTFQPFLCSFINSSEKCWISVDGVTVIKDSTMSMQSFKIHINNMVNRIRTRETASEGLLTQVEAIVHKRRKFKISLVATSIPNQRVTLPIAAFIVPQGREYDYLFSREKGMLELASSNSIKYLFIVLLLPETDFSSTTFLDIQKEVSPYLLELKDKFIGEEYFNTKIHIMGLGETTEEQIGQRKEIFRKDSTSCGTVIVEDVLLEGDWYRRLRYDAFEGIQTECKLRHGDPDFSELSFECHQAMISCLYLCPRTSFDVVLCLGLGGGSIASYLLSNDSLQVNRVVGVEIEPLIAKLGRKHFGLESFIQSNQLVIHEQNALTFVIQRQEKFSAIFIDIDNRKTQTGILAPPQQFLEVQFLEKLMRITEHVLILNLVSHSIKEIEECLEKFNSIFAEVRICKVSESSNYCVACFLQPTQRKAESIPNEFKEYISELKNTI